MVADLLRDDVDPGVVGEITAGVLDRVFDYPAVVARAIATESARFGFADDGGIPLLDYLLTLADYRDKDQMIALASSG